MRWGRQTAKCQNGNVYSMYDGHHESGLVDERESLNQCNINMVISSTTCEYYREWRHGAARRSAFFGNFTPRVSAISQF